LIKQNTLLCSEVAPLSIHEQCHCAPTFLTDAVVLVLLRARASSLPPLLFNLAPVIHDRPSPADRPDALGGPSLCHPPISFFLARPQCSARRRAAPRRSHGSRRRGVNGGRWPRRWRRTSCTSTFSCLGGPSRRMRRWYVFIAMPGRRVFGGCLARLNGSGPGACGDGGMWRRDGTGGATGPCWVWRLVSVVCDTAQVQTARRAQWGSLGHVVASGSAQPMREAWCVSLAVDRPCNTVKPLW